MTIELDYKSESPETVSQENSLKRLREILEKKVISRRLAVFGTNYTVSTAVLVSRGSG